MAKTDNVSGFLPICREDMDVLGWSEADFVFVIGDAYVDHSSFGPAIISRVLESRGFNVAIISQPDISNPDSIKICGTPRLGFLVCGGNMDSMVNHYTVSKRKRENDAYTPGGVMGKRPDYAATAYSKLIRKEFPNIPIIIGGIEASLRRMAHYDYWSDRIKPSILMDSGADLISYGMGELSIVEIAEALDSGLDVKDITFIKGTVFKTKDISSVYDAVKLPMYEDVKQSTPEGKKAYAESFAVQYKNTDFITAKPLAERYETSDMWVVQNPPMRPLTTQEMDDIYELPYMNTYHPSYKALGGVPAISEIKFSLTSNRGCFGGCSFCALTFHQGRIVQVRSHESLVREAEKMTKDPEFKGYIHDVGGPTADFRKPACDKQLKKGVCSERQCLFPTPCPNLKPDHSDYIALLRKLRSVPRVKKVFVRSGIRFDYVMADKNRNSFVKELCEHHVSGQLRVAPEHVSDRVLSLMGKPSGSVYKDFCSLYETTNQALDKKQYVVPYLMSSHPGSHLADAIALAESIRDMGYMPEQVQDFYPTPSTVSTCMYYTGLDPRTMKKVYVPKSSHEKAMQRALIQYRKPENYDLVLEALLSCNRQDLIGYDKSKCLIMPRKSSSSDKSFAHGKTVNSKNRSTSNKNTPNKGNDFKKKTGFGGGKKRPNDRGKTGGKKR